MCRPWSWMWGSCSRHGFDIQRWKIGRCTIDSNSVIEKHLYKILKLYALLFATFVSNCYFSSFRLFINTGGKLKSTEGTTQRDTIAMIIYTIATIPLILMTIEIMRDQPGNTSKLIITFANDFTTAGTLTELKVLWNILCDLGTKFGCYPCSFKSLLIVKRIELKEHPFYLRLARSI